MNIIAKFNDIIIDKNQVKFMYNGKENALVPLLEYIYLLNKPENKLTFLMFFSKKVFDYLLVYIDFL